MKLIRYQQPNLNSSLGSFSSLFEDALTSLAPLGSFSEQANSSARSPHVTYKETDTGFDFVFEVPGVGREDISIEIEKNVLTVQSGKAAAETSETASETPVKASKIRYFSQVRLPQHLDLEAAEANLENGVLTVSFPKAPQAQARQIKIN